jgi:hypothetical protein
MAEAGQGQHAKGPNSQLLHKNHAFGTLSAAVTSYLIWHFLTMFYTGKGSGKLKGIFFHIAGELKVYSTVF